MVLMADQQGDMLIPKCIQNSNAFGEPPYANFFDDCLNAYGVFPNAYWGGIFQAHFIANGVTHVIHAALHYLD